MSLRLRLFLLIAGLVCLLLVGQALLVRSLAGRLDRDVAAVAVHFGEEILSGFTFETREESGEPGRQTLWVASGAANGVEVVEGNDETGTASAEEPKQTRQVETRWVLKGRSTAGGPARPEELAEPPLTLLREGGHEVVFLRGPLTERRIEIPHTPVATTLGRFRTQLLIGSLAILGLGLVAAGAVAHRATRPLGELEAAARRIGGGELGVEVAVRRNDEIGAALGAFNSMSRRLAALDRENRRLAASEHLSELGEVARGLAHTLRNPLNALGLTVDRLAEGPGDEAAGELAERCRLQIRRIDGALRSFLALASAPAASAGPVELGGLAREVALEALQDSASRVGVDVVAPGPVELLGVAAELKAVLQALVVNACEASPPGGRVTVEVERAPDGGARLVVGDEGPGLAPEVAGRLYSPHVTTKPQGSGMGLYLAQRIAAMRYDGGVELLPRVPCGTNAVLTLGPRREGGA